METWIMCQLIVFWYYERCCDNLFHVSILKSFIVQTKDIISLFYTNYHCFNWLFTLLDHYYNQTITLYSISHVTYCVIFLTLVCMWYMVFDCCFMLKIVHNWILYQKKQRKWIFHRLNKVFAQYLCFGIHTISWIAILCGWYSKNNFIF